MEVEVATLLLIYFLNSISRAYEKLTFINLDLYGSKINPTEELAKSS